MLRFLVLLLFVASVAPQVLLAQFGPPESMPVGRDFSPSATAATLRFDLPEPVGWIEVSLEFSQLDTSASPEHVQLTGGRVMFRDHGTLELPPQFLGCIPFLRPRQTGLLVVFPDLEEVEGDWFSNFLTYIEIFYGLPTYIPYRAVEYSSLRITLKGSTLHRVLFTEQSGDRFRVDPFPAACSADLIEWLK